ncbi:MAG TPA: hypothetical protein DIT35_05765 [Rhodospirillaceae bacterium]|nr:hypothetical protein [Rhodospirillaceae bacterium]
MLKKLNKAALDPGLFWFWAYARLLPHGATRRGSLLARRAGLRGPHFILSFDCDTDADSRVVQTLHARLRSNGLSPLYAVAGEVLDAASDAYQNISDDGAVFLNHGFRRHAALDKGTGEVTSTYFYGDVPVDDWQADIRRGHEAVADILGQRPDGFRTPHFASFESPGELATLWRFLTALDYKFSSSTRPLFGLRHGPFFKRAGIMEFPVSGCLSEPRQILDTWGLVRGGSGTTQRLREELRAYLKIMQTGQPLLLNLYMDPVDIAKDDAVIDLLAGFAPYSVASFAATLAQAHHG